jgi:ribonuclease HII
MITLFIVKSYPHLDYELRLWEKGYVACGVDEVGRGSFAGPLVAAGVILKPIDYSDYSAISTILSAGINDSKLLSPSKRAEVVKNVQDYILFSTVQYVSVLEINKFGIGKVNKLAFSKVAQSIRQREVFFLTDFFPIPKIPKSKQKNIVSGDQISISIALASIIAKLERDKYMEELSTEFPEYGFQKHKGYGTRLHRTSISEYGLCEIHRTEFVKNYV